MHRNIPPLKKYAFQKLCLGICFQKYTSENALGTFTLSPRQCNAGGCESHSLPRNECYPLKTVEHTQSLKRRHPSLSDNLIVSPLHLVHAVIHQRQTQDCVWMKIAWVRQSDSNGETQCTTLPPRAGHNDFKSVQAFCFRRGGGSMIFASPSNDIAMLIHRESWKLSTRRLKNWSWYKRAQPLPQPRPSLQLLLKTRWSTRSALCAHFSLLGTQ